MSSHCDIMSDVGPFFLLLGHFKTQVVIFSMFDF